MGFVTTLLVLIFPLSVIQLGYRAARAVQTRLMPLNRASKTTRLCVPLAHPGSALSDAAFANAERDKDKKKKRNVTASSVEASS